MRWQYTFARFPNERDRCSRIYRANDFCLEQLVWNSDGTYTWVIVKLTNRAAS